MFENTYRVGENRDVTGCEGMERWTESERTTSLNFFFWKLNYCRKSGSKNKLEKQNDIVAKLLVISKQRLGRIVVGA